MTLSILTPPVPAIADKAQVRVGAGLKRGPSMAPTHVADVSKVRVGAGLKLPPASVADATRVRVGAGLKRR